MSLSDLQYIPVLDNGADTGQGAAFNLSLGGEVKHNGLHVLVREQLQNSIDAYNEMGANKPPVLKFCVTRKELDRKLIKAKELSDQIEKCHDYRESDAGGSGDLPDEVVKLKEAVKGLRGNGKMWCTIFEDNAGGIRGTTRNLRKEQDTIWEKFLGKGETTKHGKNSLGSFGVGKFAAWNNNNTFTVFYLNTFRGKNYFIGRTMLLTYYTKDDGNNAWVNKWDEDLYFGKKGVNSNGYPIADLYPIDKVDDTGLLETFRTLEGDGLSTIIPTIQRNFKGEKEWAKEIAYSIIQSFFKAFEKGLLEVVVNDGYDEEVIELSKDNYQDKYREFVSLESVKEEDDAYQYYLLRPQILGEKPSVFEKNFKVGTYEGKAKLSVYRNEELERKLDTIRNTEKRRTFRIIRENMLIRDEGFPRNRTYLEDNEYSGVLEFVGDKLNSVVKKGETKSHDKIDMSNYDETRGDFPKANQVVVFYQSLSKWIKEEVDKLSGAGTKEGDEQPVYLDLGNLFGGSEVPSFERTFLDPNKHPEAYTNNEGSKRVIKRDADTNNQEGENRGVIEVDGRGKKKRNRKTKRKTYRKKVTSKLIDDSVQNAKRISILEKISLFQKISSSGGSNNTYKIQLNNVEDKVDVVLSQETAFERDVPSAFLSFRLESVKMNGSDFSNFKGSENKYGDVVSYTLKGLEPSKRMITLDLSVTEPSETESKFKIKLS